MRTPFKLKGTTLPGPFKQIEVMENTPPHKAFIRKSLMNVPSSTTHYTSVASSLDKFVKPTSYNWLAKSLDKTVKTTSTMSKVLKFLGSKAIGIAGFMTGAHSASAQGLTEKEKIIDYSKIIGNLPVGGESSSTSVIKQGK